MENAKATVSGCLVAVDGGGTKTEICILDLAAKRTTSIVFGSANYKSSNKQTAADNITRGFREALRAQNFRTEDVRGAVFGIAGCDTPADEQFYRGTIASLGLADGKAFLCNDSELGLLAMEDEGICAVAGTGSIATGIAKDGRKKRAGGWGAPLSDEGSGWWIANEVLRRYLRWADGMGENSPVFARITEKCGGGKVPAAVSGIAAMTTRQIASLAQEIMRAANEGEPLCGEIVAAAAGHIAEIIACVYRGLGFGDRPRVSTALFGSLFNDDRFRDGVAEALRTEHGIANLAFFRIEQSPANCGLSLAKKLFLHP